MNDVEGGRISKYNIDIIFETYSKRLVNYANSFLNDFNLSEDIVQEVFLRLWEIKNEIQINNSLKEYLFRSVRNKCINYRRDRKFESIYQSGSTLQTDGDQFVFIQSDKEDNFHNLYQAIKHLTPKRQQILHYGLFGLKNQEIAEIMGVSVNTLKTQKSHAYRKLRIMLEL